MRGLLEFVDVNEVDDDDAAEVAQANLADDLLDGFEVGLDDGVLEARGALADEFAGVDVDGYEGFGVVDDDIAAGLEPDFGAQRFVELVLDAEFLEDRRFLGVELDLVDELRLEAADELDDLAVLLLIVNPNAGEIVADVIAEDALDKIEVPVEQSGSFALLAAFLDFVPGLAEELDVGANLVVGGAACCGADDEAAGISAAGFTDETTKPRAVFGGDNFARYPGVMDRGQLDQAAARQSDVAGDARALLAERFLGDLDDDVLAGLQHFGNELRAARRTPSASLITAVLPGAAGTAFETRSAAAGASATIAASATLVGTSTTAIRAATTAIASTVASTAAERPLEARTRIAANARGVAREVFTRSARAANARGTSFAWEKNHVVFDGRRAFGEGFAGGRRNRFLFDMFSLDVFVLDVFVLDVFVLDMFVTGLFMLTMRFGMFGVLLSHVRGEFRAAGGASRFDFFRFFLGEFRVRF